LPARSQIAPQQHHRALPFVDAPEFVAQVAAREGIAAQALLFLTFTAARTGEVVGARWSEIDLKHAVWTVPASRMKAGKEHKVPLSEPALRILKALPREGDFVFPGGREGAPLSNMAMNVLLRRMGRSDVVPHGLRSVFLAWGAERTNYPNHVVEMALAHTIGDKVEKAYRRGDLFAKRTALMCDWAKFCTTKPASSTDNVVSIRGGA
jgi:integrase